MDPSLPLISKPHRRPILMPSSSFSQLASGGPMSPPATPSRSASLRRRATAAPGEQPTTAGVVLASSSSSRPSSPSTPTSRADTMSSANDEKRPPPVNTAVDKKGKGREVLGWAEGFDRALGTMGGRDATMKLVQYVSFCLSKPHGERKLTKDCA
jgi:hypothetical protein